MFSLNYLENFLTNIKFLHQNGANTISRSTSLQREMFFKSLIYLTVPTNECALLTFLDIKKLYLSTTIQNKWFPDNGFCMIFVADSLAEDCHGKLFLQNIVSWTMLGTLISWLPSYTSSSFSHSQFLEVCCSPDYIEL